MRIRISMGPRRGHSRFAALAGGLICAVLSATGFYVAVSGAPVAGGIPFIPAAWNQGLGRALIALGAMVTGALAACAFYEALTAKHGKDPRRPPQ
jgi:hypothetical protein